MRGRKSTRAKNERAKVSRKNVGDQGRIFSVQIHFNRAIYTQIRYEPTIESNIHDAGWHTYMHITVFYRQSHMLEKNSKA